MFIKKSATSETFLIMKVNRETIELYYIIEKRIWSFLPKSKYLLSVATIGLVIFYEMHHKRMHIRPLFVTCILHMLFYITEETTLKRAYSY